MSPSLIQDVLPVVAQRRDCATVESWRRAYQNFFDLYSADPERFITYDLRQARDASRHMEQKEQTTFCSDIAQICDHFDPMFRTDLPKMPDEALGLPSAQDVQSATPVRVAIAGKPLSL